MWRCTPPCRVVPTNLLSKEVAVTKKAFAKGAGVKVVGQLYASSKFIPIGSIGVRSSC